jgi:hypothetical protein
MHLSFQTVVCVLTALAVASPIEHAAEEPIENEVEKRVLGELCQHRPLRYFWSKGIAQVPSVLIPMALHLWTAGSKQPCLGEAEYWQDTRHSGQ